MKKILLIFTILFSSIGLSACGNPLAGVSSSSSQNQFVGKWEMYYSLEADELYVQDNYFVEFTDDGTCKISDGDYILNGTYQVHDKSHADIIVKSEDSDETTTLSASIDDDDILNMGFDELSVYLIRE